MTLSRRPGMVAISSLVVMLVYEYSAFATIKPKVDIRAVCSNANVIVAGRITSVEITDKTIRQFRSGREHEMGLWRAVIKIEQVIKGQGIDENIAVEYPGIRKGQTSVVDFWGYLEHLNPEERVVLFLKTNEKGTGAFSFANEYRSVIRIADSPAVTHMLEAQLPLSKPEQQIASLLTVSLDVSSIATIEQTLADLTSLEGKRAGATINTLLDRSREPAIRGEALATLIRLADYTRLAEAVEFLLSERESDRAVINAKVNLSIQMALVNESELVAKYYIPLLRHPTEFIRRDAFHAVRKARARIMAPELISGLEDNNQDIRYDCVMGLAGALGRTDDWEPSKEVFQKNECDYIRRWQTWWDSGGRNEFKNLPH